MPDADAKASWKKAPEMLITSVKAADVPDGGVKAVLERKLLQLIPVSKFMCSTHQAVFPSKIASGCNSRCAGPTVPVTCSGP